MRGIGALVRSFLDAVGLHVPPWMGLVAFALLLSWAVPMMQKNANTSKARRLVRSMVAAPPAERPAMAEQALGLVAGNPAGLAVVAREATNGGFDELARRALAELKKKNPRSGDVRVLARDLAPRVAALPEEDVLRIERLLEAGLTAQARLRLGEALARWPGHPGLLALQARAAEDPGHDA